jgi:hypothetical protein
MGSRMTCHAAILLALFYAGSARAHLGGLDNSGGHINRKIGEYHCHREPCVSQHEQTQRATDEAEQTGASFSLLYHRDDWGGWIDF